MAEQDLLSLVKRLEAVALKLESTAGGSGAGAAVNAASLADFDEIVNGPFKNFLDLSKRIGSEVATMGDMVETAVKAHRAYLELATKAKKPSDGELPMLQKETFLVYSDKLCDGMSFES